jgi:hypothetical protein
MQVGWPNPPALDVGAAIVICLDVIDDVVGAFRIAGDAGHDGFLAQDGTNVLDKIGEGGNYGGGLAALNDALQKIKIPI